MSHSTEIAETIVAQLCKSTRALSLMIGGHSYTAFDKGLVFRFKAKARNASNCCRITLQPTDTYKVEFLSVRGTKVTPKGEFEDVYAENLKPLFESKTGLYLSL